MMKKTNLFLLLTVLFYVAGVLVMVIPDKKEPGSIGQEEYQYTRRDREKRPGISLHNVKGLGKVLTYEDVYWGSVSLFLPALICGLLVFGKKRDELNVLIFTNCMIGVFLIRVTDAGHIIPTLLFWGGIIMAAIANSIFNNHE